MTYATCGRPRLRLAGQIFGRLTVISFAYVDERAASHWHCLCDCGAHKVVKGGSLKFGESRSCGCLARELSRINVAKARAGRRQRATTPHDLEAATRRWAT